MKNSSKTSEKKKYQAVQGKDQNDYQTEHFDFCNNSEVAQENYQNPILKYNSNQFNCNEKLREGPQNVKTIQEDDVMILLGKSDSLQSAKLFDPQFQQSSSDSLTTESLKNLSQTPNDLNENSQLKSIVVGYRKVVEDQTTSNAQVYKDKARKILQDLTTNIQTERQLEAQKKQGELNINSPQETINYCETFGIFTPQAKPNQKDFFSKAKKPQTTRNKQQSSLSSGSSQTSVIIRKQLSSSQQSSQSRLHTNNIRLPYKAQYLNSNDRTQNSSPSYNQFDPQAYKQAVQERDQIRNQLKIQHELQGFTGKPEINKKSSTIKRRINDLIEWKMTQDQKRENELQKRQLAECELIQKMQTQKFLSKKSEQMIEHKIKDHERVEDRLMRDAVNRLKKKNQYSNNHSKSKSTKRSKTQRNSKSPSSTKNLNIIAQIISSSTTSQSNTISSIKNIRYEKDKCYTTRVSQQFSSRISSRQVSSTNLNNKVKINEKEMKSQVASPKNNYLSRFITPQSEQKYQLDLDNLLQKFTSESKSSQQDSLPQQSSISQQTAIFSTFLTFQQNKIQSNLPQNFQIQQQQQQQQPWVMLSNSSFNSTTTVPIVSAAVPNNHNNNGIINMEFQRQQSLQEITILSNDYNTLNNSRSNSNQKIKMFTVDPNHIRRKQSINTTYSAQRNKNQETAIINKILDSSFMPTAVNEYNAIQKQSNTINKSSSQENISLKTSGFYKQNHSSENRLQTEVLPEKDDGEYSFYKFDLNLIDDQKYMTNDSHVQELQQQQQDFEKQEDIKLNQESSINIEVPLVNKIIQQDKPELPRQYSQELKSPKKSNKHISKQNTSSSTKDDKPTHVKFLQRNTEWFDQKINKLEKAKEIYDLKQERTCTFRPQINNKDDSKLCRSNASSIKRVLTHRSRSKSKKTQELTVQEDKHQKIKQIQYQKQQKSQDKSKSKKKKKVKLPKKEEQASQLRDFGVQVGIRNSLAQQELSSSNEITIMKFGNSLTTINKESPSRKSGPDFVHFQNKSSQRISSIGQVVQQQINDENESYMSEAPQEHSRASASTVNQEKGNPKRQIRCDYFKLKPLNQRN